MAMNGSQNKSNAAGGHASDRRVVLRGLPMFAGFPDADIGKLAEVAQGRAMRKGETLIRTGDPGSFMMIVLAGEVRVMLTAASGREQIVNTLGPGAIIGEIALFDGQPRTADVVAATHGRLLTIERVAMRRLIEEDARLALRVIEMLCARLRNTMVQLESMVFDDVASRLAASLSSLAKGNPKRLDMTQSALATLIGASREIVNKRLRQLARDGAVALSPGRVVILDEALLFEQCRPAPPQV
jgi:CRP-like cAMP-binding protein